MLAGTLCVLAGLVFFVKPFYDRFFTGDTQLQVGGMNINVSGRARVWNAVIESAWERPYIGHGLGSSQALTASGPASGGPSTSSATAFSSARCMTLPCARARALGGPLPNFADRADFP